jgi:RHS repeat-associated protein
MRLEAAAASATPLAVWAASASETPLNLGIEWDAENRLIAVDQGTLRYEFAYDGRGKRARKTTRQNGIVAIDRRLLWCGSLLCEERDAATGAVQRRLLGNAFQEGGVSYFLTLDHLGSLREVTNSSGQLQRRDDYDPYGRPRVVVEGIEAPLGFGAHSPQDDLGLVLAKHRAYDPSLGRWLSDDPAGLIDGPNRFAYALNSPVTNVDPLGLAVATPGCQTGYAKALQAAAAKAEAAVDKGCCLPEGEDKAKWVQKIRTARYHCVDYVRQGQLRYPITYCAVAEPPGGKSTGCDATFFDLAFIEAKDPLTGEGCGCLQGTLLHEVAHLMGHADESYARKVASGCFRCARDPD